MVKRKIEEVADGVFIEPMPITAGETVRVKYKGKLASQAGKVYLHMGFGRGNWHSVQDIPMRKTRDGAWNTNVEVIDAESALNFCFRSESNVWDNNNGMNWILEVHNG